MYVPPPPRILKLTSKFAGCARDWVHQHALLLDSSRNRRTHLALLRRSSTRRSSLNSNSIASEEHYPHHRRFGLHSRGGRSGDTRAGVQVNGRRSIELFRMRTGGRRILCRMRLMNDECRCMRNIYSSHSYPTQRLLVLLLESSSSSLDRLGNLSSSSLLRAAFTSSDRSSTCTSPLTAA